MSLDAVVAVTGHLQLQLLLAGEESVWLCLDQELPGEKEDQQDQHDCHSQPHCDSLFTGSAWHARTESSQL